MAKIDALKQTGINSPKGKKTGTKKELTKDDLAGQPQRSQRSKNFDSKIQSASNRSSTDINLKNKSDDLYNKFVDQSLDTSSLPQSEPKQKKETIKQTKIKGGNIDVKPENLGGSENNKQNKPNEEDTDRKNFTRPQALGKLPYIDRYGDEGNYAKKDKEQPDYSMTTPNTPTDNLDPYYSMPSAAEENFKFNNDIDLEDPTYLTFDIIMYKEQRPLWDDKVGYGANVFLSRYSEWGNGEIRKIKEAKEKLKEFRYQLETIFYTVGNPENDTENNNETINNILSNKKPYYIESIAGLQNLKKPIINYGEDILTITLSEDIKMKAEYIAELYNQMYYDYRLKKEIIPENCLRFDMAIVISDVRKFKDYLTKKNDYIEEHLNKFTPSRQIYIVRDCNFNFMNSFNIQDSINQAGYNSQNPEISNLQFTIKYKSAERTFFADLFKKTNRGGNNSYKNIDLTTHNLIDERNSDRDYYRSKHTERSFGSKKREQEFKNIKNWEYPKKGWAKLGIPNPNKKNKENVESKNINETKTNQVYSSGLLDRAKSKAFDIATENINEYSEKLKKQSLSEVSEFIEDNIDDLVDDMGENADWLYEDLGNVYVEDDTPIGEEIAKDVTQQALRQGLQGGINSVIGKASGALSIGTNQINNKIYKWERSINNPNNK